ncbi:sulfite exporter TauE/SafE family protein [Bacillus sp. PS06]|uniref:sulfite exporter TauE/SafE family protein n=1 Tax=Bacillus sp. PS06 TaxID=2764176 RepID=UPI0017833B63|nr:sulfite exporter TauE/SafE family protein [Bacillus sp. PS06]MBD8067859.1 sulfite exporter TauE/SafE family protein [Bacillus sp. PS06]
MELFEWFISITVAILIGVSKTAISTLGIFNVSLLVQVFPAKDSVGIMLPMLIIADIFAVFYYRRSVVWKHLFSLIPWVLAGIFIGFFVLWKVNSEQLSLLLGVLILTLIILQVGKDSIKSNINQLLPESKWFTYAMGVLAGFATMIGNVSGVIMSIYLIAKRLPKNEFIGTGAWFYLFVNIIKIPFYLFLGMVSTDSFYFNMTMIPFIIIGAFLGIFIIKFIPEKIFHWIILALGTIGAIKLIFPG